jgi:hypothetical protein
LISLSDEKGDMEKMRVDSQPPSCLNYRTTRPPPNPTIRGNLSSREASHKASNNNEHTVIKNEVSLDKIKSGQDTRTTVMIKNIPNKMTSKELVKFIGDVCPLAIDFLYLRIDFANGKAIHTYVRKQSTEDHAARLQCRIRICQFYSHRRPCQVYRDKTRREMVRIVLLNLGQQGLP